MTRDDERAASRPLEGGTRTDPSSPDARLRGRTYAIPFDRVWKAALALTSGALKGWELMRADDRAGVMEAERRTWPMKKVDDARIDVVLDENAQTRVDLRLRRRAGRPRVRSHARNIDRFLRELDRRLGADPSQILDPTVPPAWAEEGRG